MSNQNYDHDFREAMAEKGLSLKGPLIADSGLQRFDVDGDKPGSKNGWYVLHTDGRAKGVFGCNKRYTGHKFEWNSGFEIKPLTAAEREAMATRIKADARRRADEKAAMQAAAEKRAIRDWDAAIEAPTTHPYLERKRIGAHGTRVDGQGRLIVPVTFNGSLVSYQAILPNGEKRFLKGGQKSGCYYEIGGVVAAVASKATIVFCEGFATGASIHEATGHRVIVCFDAGNVEPVVKHFREQCPETLFVIAADNDQWNKEPVDNPGVTKALAAAEKHNAWVALPKFSKLDTKPTDFNDLHIMDGLDAVRDQIEALEWVGPMPGPTTELQPAEAPLRPHFDAPRMPKEEAALKLKSAIDGFFASTSSFIGYRGAMDAAVAAADIAAEESADDALMIPGMKGMDARAGYFEVCRITGVQPADDPSDEEIDGLRALVAERLRRDCRRNARAAVRREWEDINGNLPTPPHLQIKATAGIGKTSQLAKLLKDHPDWNVHIYSQTHALIHGTTKHLPDARLIRGRSQPVEPGSTETMCARAEVANEVSLAGLSIYENLCERGNKRCPHFEGCAYLEQWTNAEAGPTILPTAYLPIPKPAGFPKPDLVVVDESAVKELVGNAKKLHPDLLTDSGWMHDLAANLGRVGPYVESDMSADIAVAASVMGKVYNALCDTGRELDVLRATGVTKEALEAARKSLSGLAEKPTLDPGLTDSEVRRRLEKWRGGDAIKVAAMLRALTREIGLSRPGSHGVVLRDTKVLVDKEPRIEPRIHVFTTRKPKFNANETALLLLDADADIEVNRRLFSAASGANAGEDDGEVDDIKVVDIRAERRAHVIQYYSTVMGKGRTTKDTDDGDRVRAQLRALVDNETVDRVTGARKKVLVVTYKELRCKLTKEKDGSRGVSAEWNGADIAHFSNLRGINDFEDHDAVIVFGRNQPPPQSMEDKARAIWADDEEPLIFLPTGSSDADELDYDDDTAALARPKKYRAYRMSDGSARPVEVDVHPDPRVQRLWELHREAETVQAIDRLRLVHAEKPKRVIIASSVPVDITVNEAIHMRGVLKPDPVMEAYVLGGRALRLNPRLMRESYPAHFKSEDHARDHAREAKKRFAKGGENPINIFIGSFPPLDSTEPEIARFRVEGQKGVDAYGLVDPRVRPDEKFAAETGKPIIGYIDSRNISVITFPPDDPRRTKEEANEDEVDRLLTAALDSKGDGKELFEYLRGRRLVTRPDADGGA